MSDDFINQKMIDLWIESYEVVDNYIIAPSWLCNGFIIVDIRSKKIVLREKFCNEPDYKHMMYRIGKYANKVLFIPYSAQELIIYDLSNGNLKKVNCFEYIEPKAFVRKFRRWIGNGDYLYMFPGDTDYIYKVDLNKFKIINKINLCSIYTRYTNEQHSFWENYNIYCYNKYIYTIFYNSKFIMKMDTRTDSIELIELQYGVDGFYALFGIESCLLLVDIKGNIFEYDLSQKVIKKTNELPKHMKYYIEKNGIIHGIYFNKVFYFIQHNIEEILLYDFETKTIGYLNTLKQYLDNNLKDIEVDYINYREKIIYLVAGKNRIILWNIEKQQVDIDFQIDFSRDDLLNWLLKHRGDDSEQILEGDFLCLKDYIKYIIKPCNKVKLTSDDLQQTGNRIFKEIKEIYSGID